MRRILLLAAVLALSGAAFGQVSEKGDLIKLPGMRVGGTITRDANSIPQIQGFTEWDLHFLTGWVHAEDRLFQMDFFRRQASGTLAELVGPAALSSDVQLRALGLRRTASTAYGLLSKESRDAGEAYAMGVNAWVARNPLPPEYKALELTKFEPWTAVDSLAFANLFLLGQFFDTSDIDRTLVFVTYQLTGAAAGFDGTKLFFEDLVRSEPFDHTTTLPPPSTARKGERAAEEVLSSEAGPLAATEIARAAMEMAEAGALDLIQQYLARVEDAPYYRDALNKGRDRGSNEWAVSGKLSGSGFPLLASDPHLSLGTPSTWYPMALRGGPINAVGMGAAGAPFVLLGNTPWIAWGATNNPVDVTDVYLEKIVPDPSSSSGLAVLYKGAKEPLVAIPEVFQQNNIGDGKLDNLTVVPPSASIPPATLLVPRRNFGPIIQLDAAKGTALSVQYTGFSPTREIDGFRKWNTSRSIDDFKKGLENVTVGSFNWSVISTSGDIAYLTSGEWPLREDLQAMAPKGVPPWFIRDGTGGNEWVAQKTAYPGQALPYEILPPAEHPQAVNPAAGYFVNANNDPIGVTLGNNPLGRLRPGGGLLYLSAGYDGFRCGRVTQVIKQKLAASGKISFADMKAIQADNVLIDAQFFVPYLTKALDNAKASGADPALAALGADAGVAAAVARLKSWDFSTPTGLTEGWDPGRAPGTPPPGAQVDASVAATIYSVWRGRFAANVIDATLAPLKLPVPSNNHNGTLPELRHLLETFPTAKGVGASGLNFFAVKDVAKAEDRRDIVILKSVADALQLLASNEFAPAFARSTSLADYRWGKLHRITFAHPLGGPFSVPPAGGAFPPTISGLPGISRPGGTGTVDVANHSVRVTSVNGFTFGSGPSRRYVGEATPEGIHAESSLPGGVSGVLGPLYVNLLPMWLTNGTYPAPVMTGPKLPWTD